MERYGQTMTLTPQDGGEPLETKAFLQPLRKKSAELPVAVTPLGPVSEQRWLYIGRAAADISVGSRITCGEARLVVQEVRSVFWQDEVLYQWATLRQEKEAAV